MALSRLETGNVTLRLEAVDLRAVIAETLDLVEVQAAADSIRLGNEDPGRAAWVRGDRSRLKQVFVNLASNALKYNRRQGHVRFSIAAAAAVPGTTRVKLSGLQGMHLLKSIKTDPGLQHLRCIAVDASAQEMLELQSAGFEGRWMRPIDPKDIWSGLKAVLSDVLP